MTTRIIALLTALLLIASACSSGSDTAVAGSVDGSTPTAPDTDSPTNGEEGSDAGVTTPPSGPTTTFVPNLAGPFSTEGGAERFEGTAGLIIDADAPGELPPPLNNYNSWPTDWTRRTIEDFTEVENGLSGPDPRDGIPPIDTPIFESVALASQWLGDREPGALVQVDGDARFYPLGILHTHEIVNDAFGDIPVAVTYCPLCNTALAFDRRVDGETLRLGVSGLLRNSDLVMWDDKTTSLWQQITGEGIIGEYAGTQLETLPTAIVSFGQFRQEFPDGKSLAAESGRGRQSYGRNPYGDYSSSDRPFRFRGDIDDSYPALSRVVGLLGEDVEKAYPFELVQQEQVINDTVNGTSVVILWGGDTADALDGPATAIGQAIGTAIAFNPVVDGQMLTFAVGPDTDTFVDDETGSTWSVLGLATAGELEGTRLETLTHRNEFWFAWQAFFGTDNVYQ